MRVVFLACILSATVVAAPAYADGDTGPAPPNPDEVVCRLERPMIGSHLGFRKVCKTRADWAAEQPGPSLSDNPAISVHSRPGMRAEGAPRTPGSN